MKTLYVIRHGKSSWDYPQLADIDRPLKKRGKNDARLMGKLLKEKRLLPDVIISSPAIRAYKAAEIMAEELNYNKVDIQIEKALYFNGIQEIFNTIHKIDDRNNSAFIYGHNPDFTSFANIFTDQRIDNVPTCGISCVQFDTDSWKKAQRENGSLLFFDYPSRHK